MRVPPLEYVPIRRKSLRFPRAICESYDERGPAENEPEPFATANELYHLERGVEVWGYPASSHQDGPYGDGDYWVSALYDWLMGSAWTIDDAPDGSVEAVRSNIQWRKDTSESARPRSPQLP